MNCPLCIDQTLDVTHRRGVELDICPKCRGIWLDRGEIDRLIAEDDPPPPPTAAARVERDRDTRSDDRDRKRKKRKKKSFADRLSDAIEDAIDDLT